MARYQLIKPLFLIDRRWARLEFEASNSATATAALLFCMPCAMFMGAAVYALRRQLSL